MTDEITALRKDVDDLRKDVDEMTENTALIYKMLVEGKGEQAPSQPIRVTKDDLTDGEKRLLSFLFDGKRQLVNFKIFPGTKENVSTDERANAITDALQNAVSAWENGIKGQAPDTGLEKR